MPTAPAGPSVAPQPASAGRVRWVFYTLAVSPKYLDAPALRAFAEASGFTVYAAGEVRTPKRRKVPLPPGVTPGPVHVVQVCDGEPLDFSGRTVHLERHVTALLAKVSVADAAGAVVVDPPAAAPPEPAPPPKEPPMPKEEVPKEEKQQPEPAAPAAPKTETKAEKKKRGYLARSWDEFTGKKRED